MALKLEPYAVHRALHRGPQLYELVASNQKELAESFPRTVERNRDPAHAIYNYGRLALVGGVYPYLVLDEETDLPKGSATLMPNQRLRSSTQPEVDFMGTDADYWLELGATLEEHELVGAGLIDIAGKRFPYSNLVVGVADEFPGGVRMENRVMAAMQLSKPLQPLGLMTADGMEMFGRPSQFITPGDPAFELAKGGATLQLYTGILPISSNA